MSQPTAGAPVAVSSSEKTAIPSIHDKQDVEAIEHADRPAHRAHDKQHRLDAAAELLRKQGAGEGERIPFSAADDRRVLRKIDLVILPLLLVVYFLQALDKATLSYASVFGLTKDTGLVGTQYSWLGSIVYLAQLVMQPILAWMLIRLPIGKFCAVMVFAWGTTLACMAAAHNFAGLLVTRFFLGAFEASIAPAFLAVTQMWWRRREQTVRVASWYAMNGITNMFGSLMTYGLGHIQGGALKSYQIIFLFFGCITVAFSFVMLMYMPDSPVEAKFLDDQDKVIAIERLRANNMGVMSREWRWDHVKEAFLDVKTWCWFSMLFAISIPSGGISTFGPLIVQSFGFDSFTTILFNIPFGFVQTLATMLSAYLATRFKVKGPFLAALSIPPVIGCVVMLVLPHDGTKKAGLLVGYYLISVYPAITPMIYSWSSQNTAGDTKQKCTTAILFVGQSVGNIVGPQLYTQAEAPAYTRGLVSNLVLYVLIIVLVGVASLYITFLNKRHAARRVAMGKSAIVLDSSLDTAEESEAKRAAATAETDTGDNAFDNMTDLQNEDFTFVY